LNIDDITRNVDKLRRADRKGAGVASGAAGAENGDIVEAAWRN
jgi:hypothetical protein